MTAAGPDATAITLTIPAQSRFVAISRVTAASLGAELDFDVAAIDDLRVAANELVASLIEWAEDHDAGWVTLTYRLHDDTVELSGRVDGADDGGDDDTDPLSTRILAAVTDEFLLGGGHGWLRKRRVSVP